jgi:hypothetical protein
VKGPFNFLIWAEHRDDGARQAADASNEELGSTVSRTVRDHDAAVLDNFYDEIHAAINGYASRTGIPSNES